MCVCVCVCRVIQEYKCILEYIFKSGIYIK